MIGAVLIAGFSYSAGFASGRTQGGIIGNTTNAAMRFGPQAAAAWSLLMAYNNPVSAMSAYKKSISTNANGRHYCLMPAWIDPPQPVNATQ